MSFADVVPLSGAAGCCLQEVVVDWQKGANLQNTDAAPVESALGGMSQRMAEQLGLSVASMGLGGSLVGGHDAVISSGFRSLDRLLPSGGIRRGTLMEWLPASGQEVVGQTQGGQELRQPGARQQAADSGRQQSGRGRQQSGHGRQQSGRGQRGGLRQGGGVVTLALALAVQIARAPGVGGVASAGATTVLVVDRSGWFYPPAVMRWLAAAHGQRQSTQCVVVRPSRDDDEVWAIDQALRCVGVAAVVACPAESVVCSNVMRRWQLAARSSGVVGMLVRPWECRRDPSWAEVRLVAAPLRRPINNGRISPLRSPAVSPRSEAVLRCWQIERLSSVLYGEGVRCEVAIDLERGTEVSLAGRPPLVQCPSLVRRSEGVLFQPLKRKLQELSEKAFREKAYRKDGVACRAS
jgi:hypothetical protein